MGRAHYTFAKEVFPTTKLPSKVRSYPSVIGMRVRQFHKITYYDFDCSSSWHVWVMGVVVGMQFDSWSDFYGKELFPEIKLLVKIEKWRSAFDKEFDQDIINETEHEMSYLFRRKKHIPKIEMGPLEVGRYDLEIVSFSCW